MPETFVQPDAATIPADLIERLVRHALPHATARKLSYRVAHHHGHTNDVAEVRFADGRTLMIKRGRYDWSVARFQASRAAAAMLGAAGIVAPAPLPLPEGLDARPVEAYWRVPQLTLAELWPSFGPAQRRQALRSWGELVARVHSVRLSGHGSLADAARPEATLDQFLAVDLGWRLFPAIAGEWPAVLDLVELLKELVPEVSQRAPASGSLLHGDLHMENVLCDVQGEEVRCVGVLDLETAHAGPPESDLSRIAISNTSLFHLPLPGRWMDRLLEGYRAKPDPVVTGFFRIYHYLNLGFHSQLVGHHWHADQIAGAARQDAVELCRVLKRARSAGQGKPQRMAMLA